MTSAKTKQKSIFRQTRASRDWSRKQERGYYAVNMGLAVLSAIVLGVSCLLLSYSTFDARIFGGCFAHPAVAVLNTAIVLALYWVLYALIGKLWISYALTSLLCLGICIGNYYLIIIRCDPLLPEDISCLREALSISASQHYDLSLTWQVVVPVLACTASCVCLALFARCTPRLYGRIALLITGVLVAAGVCAAVLSNDLYQSAMANNEYINLWSTTQIYASKGTLYSFLREALTISGKKPSGYDKEQTAADMNAYTDADIPAEQKVNLIIVMRESYNDLSDLGGSDGVDWQTPYETYHALAAESYTGRMVANSLGGNTKDAERCFLTGGRQVPNFRSAANSYLWYLREQGYYTEGAHPFNGWFYNRQNFNSYIGFENYYFAENRFDALVGTDKTADDDVLYDQLYQLFEAHDDTPYFSYSVTFEGHGPYNYTGTEKQEHSFVTDRSHKSDANAMNDYLNCVYKRDKELLALVDRLRQSDRPVVLMVYGDHNATLGKDINNYTTAAYETFGINMDESTPDGFLNYYSTEYLIWANDAAKAVLDFDFTGEGPTVSPCYLMNVLADCLGWKGSAHMQLMHKYMDAVPVISSKGGYLIDGELVQEIPDQYAQLKKQMDCVNYYWQHEFLYEDLQ